MKPSRAFPVILAIVLSLADASYAAAPTVRLELPAGVDVTDAIQSAVDRVLDDVTGLDLGGLEAKP